MAKTLSSTTLFILTLLTLTHCGGGSAGAPTSSSSTPVPIEILSATSLPSLSAPVVASSSSDLASPLKVVDVTKGATTGFALSDTTACAANATTSSCKFSTLSSINMCEHVMGLGGIVTTQLRADREFCLFQQLTSALSGTSITPSDGNTHIVGISWTNSSGTKPTLVKFIQNMSSGSLKDLAIFHCLNGSQNYYTKYSISDPTATNPTITIDAIEKSSKAAETTTLSGTLQKGSDGSLQYRDSKTMTATSSDDTLATKASGSFTQTPSTFAITDLTIIRNIGSEISVRINSKSELLGCSKSNPLACAVGDGTAHAISAYSKTTRDTTEHWKGDTTLATSTENYSVGTPAAAVSSSTINAGVLFSSDKAWDCSGTVEATVTLNESTVNSACSAFTSEPSVIKCEDFLNTTSFTAAPGKISISSVKVFEQNNTSNSGTLTETSGSPLSMSLNTSSGKAYFEITLSEAVNSTSVTTSNITLKTQSGSSVNVNFDFDSTGKVITVNLGSSISDTSVSLSSGTTYVLTVVGDTDTDSPIKGNIATNTVDPTKTYYIAVQ